MKLENDINVSFTIRIPVEECNSNGVVFSKDAVEEALRNMPDTPLYYKDSHDSIGYPIGKIERGAYAIQSTNSGDIQFTVDGTIDLGNIEFSTVFLLDNKVTECSVDYVTIE